MRDVKKYQAEWYSKNREARIEFQRIYYAANKARLAEMKAAKYKANREEILTKLRAKRASV